MGGGSGKTPRVSDGMCGGGGGRERHNGSLMVGGGSGKTPWASDGRWRGVGKDTMGL